MNPRLKGDHLTFNPGRPHSNMYRMMLWSVLILAGIWMLLRVDRGEVEPLFAPTPTPTRTVASYAEEGAAHFSAGNLEAAIAAYQEALLIDPGDANLWAELARIQTYSSSLIGTDTAKLARLEEALASVDRAIDLAPNSSKARAIRALVLDWTAENPLKSSEERSLLLTQANEAAVRAISLDSQNTLALTYYAEVLLDQQNWIQAQETIEQAVASDPNLMDARRVYASVLEALGQYRRAIEEYEAAAEINPNLTFLYIRIGYTYRVLQIYDKALDYFARAASINNQLQVKDPTPYIGIAKTYSQQGEFFIAARNAEKALEFDPTNADTYGQLGIIYVKSRNFEGALPVLKCSVVGCTAEENEIGGVAVEGQPLTSNTLFYYLQYASVLAALDQCELALPVLEQVRTKFPDDPTAVSIVQENLVICQRLQGSG